MEPTRQRRHEWDVQALVTLLPVVAVLPVLAVACVLLVLLARQGTETLRDSLRDASQSIARVVDAEREASVAELRRLGQAWRADPAAGAAALRRLAAPLVGDGKPFDAIVLVQEGGEGRGSGGHAVLAGAAPGAPGRAAEIARHLDEPVVTDLLAAAGGTGRIEVAVPVDRVVVVGHLNLRRLSRVLAAQAGGRTRATVLDGGQRIIARSAELERYFGQPPSAETLQALKSGRTGSARFATRDGRELFWAWQTLARPEWVVFVGAPVQEFDRALRTSMQRLLVGTAAALLLCCVAAWLVGRRLVRSINDIAALAPGLAMGHEPRYRRSGLRQVDALYRALAAAGAELNAARIARASALEAEQAARALAEEDNRRKDVFIATLSHELRNPLAPIRTAAQLMLAPATSDEQRRRAARIVERQSRTLALLLEDLLDVSRITTGRVELQRETLRVRELLEAAVEAARPLIEERRHALALRVEDEGLQVRGDRLRLVQVFSNLLHNAAKYTPPGGRIEVAAVRRGDGACVVTVRDSGIGLPPEALGRVFRMFEQIESGREMARGGLGIGLSIVEGLVALHGGTVAAHSAGLGQGSTFEVVLPAGDPPPAPTTPPTSSAPTTPTVPTTPLDARAVPRAADLQGLKVLVVDDNVDAAQTLQALLEAATGLSADCAHTGAEAEAAAARQAYQVLCLDIGLPDTTGYALLPRLRAHQPHALGVAITGWGSADDQQRAAQAGFDVHLTKPVDALALIELIAARVERGEAELPPPR